MSAYLAALLNQANDDVSDFLEDTEVSGRRFIVNEGNVWL
jgi:hypothetical protein